MKKLLVVFTALIIVLVGCGSNDSNDSKGEKNSEKHSLDGLVYEVLEFDKCEDIVSNMLKVEGNYVFVKFSVTNESDETLNVRHYNIELKNGNGTLLIDPTAAMAEIDEDGKYMEGNYLTKSEEVKAGETVELIALFSSYSESEVYKSEEVTLIIMSSDSDKTIEVEFKDQLYIVNSKSERK